VAARAAEIAVTVACVPVERGFAERMAGFAFDDSPSPTH